MNNGYSISVKCSTQTLTHLKELFKKDDRFLELQKHGIILNPSWFFKFSANFMLENMLVDEKIKEFAYDSHYGNFLDQKLIKFYIDNSI